MGPTTAADKKGDVLSFNLKWRRSKLSNASISAHERVRQPFAQEPVHRLLASNFPVCRTGPKRIPAGFPRPITGTLKVRKNDGFSRAGRNAGHHGDDHK